MEKSVSEKLLLNLINEKYDTLKQCFQSMLSALSGNEQGLKYQSIKNLNDVANSLANALATSDRPAWLNSIVNHTNGYLTQHTTSSVVVSGANWRLTKEAWKIKHSVINHNWDFSNANPDDYDFDEIYKKYRENSNLSNLFDSLIDILSKMIDGGDIDSLKAVSALNELIATLSQNKNSSYFSTMASWNFVRSFTKNLIWEQIGSISAIKNLKKAFEKTIAETDLELDDMHKNIMNEMKEKYKITVQSALTYNMNDTLLIEKDDKKV